MKRVVVIFVTVATVIGMSAAVWFVGQWAPPDFAGGAARSAKWFDRLIAEGFRYRDTQLLGVDRIAFKRLSVRKRQVGGFALGAFNVLVVDSLVINLPALSSATGAVTTSNSKLPAFKKDEDILSDLGRIQGVRADRISGLRINGLTVNRYENGRSIRVLAARSAESGFCSNELTLHDCYAETSASGRVFAKKAKWTFKPVSELVFVEHGLEQHIGL